MLLVFPTVGESVKTGEDVCFVRDINQGRFRERVAQKMADGWVVHEMTSSYRKALFGGVSSLKAEMRRGGTGNKKK